MMYIGVNLFKSELDGLSEPRDVRSREWRPPHQRAPPLKGVGLAWRMACGAPRPLLEVHLR